MSPLGHEHINMLGRYAGPPTPLTKWLDASAGPYVGFLFRCYSDPKSYGR